ncbi:6-bladed beta-propeller [Maribellus sediminis]|uniref:6-bladed beta-propeller n=1 Tax=Maribellus sediminis TaxID=2696285 RepID=UPI0014321C09|nr:6-bladed beta-propeller [Maribellus sediminis]
MKPILLIITLTLLTTTFKNDCPKTGNNNEPNRKSALNPADENTKVIDVFGSGHSDLSFKSIELIPLETLPDVLIGDFLQLKIDFEGDDFYISSNTNQKEIFRFNKEGKFLNKIGKQGGGPKEFPSIADICVHGDIVDVLSRSGNGVKIVGYKNDGTFLYSKSINLVAYSFEWLSPGYILETSYSKAYPFRVYTTDVNGKITGKYLPNTTGFSMAISGNHFSGLGSEAFYHEGYCDILYKTIDRKLLPAYTIDLREYRVPDEFYKSEPLQAFQLLKRSAFASVLNYFETPSNAFFSIRQSPKRQSNGKELIDYIFILNKDTNELFERSFKMRSEDFFKHPVTGTMNDELVFLIYPYMILSDKEAFKELAITNPEIINRLEVDDNPVLAICKIK